MSTNPDRLYELLPAIYRKRDHEQGQPLRALLQIIAEQAGVIENDIAQLYENWFIETCQDWVVPYVGDLVGYEPVHEAGQPSEARTPRDRGRNRILTPRSEVANTIRNRRRKGALYLLELLAKDAANWPARAVEFFQLLSFTQHVNHLKPNRGGTVSLRNGDAFDRINGPFDELAHTIEVRRPNSTRTRGRYNIPSIGLFVWRLRAYPVTQTLAFHLDDQPEHRYTFSVLGNNMPLFNQAAPDPEITRIAAEIHLPTPIRLKAFTEAKPGALPIASEDYYGEGKSVAIWVEGWGENKKKHLLPRENVLPANLENWQQPDHMPAKDYVAVDPERGRLVFPQKQVPDTVWLSYSYGFVAEIGGGEYRRLLLDPSAHPLSLSMFRVYDFKTPSAFVNKLKSTTPEPVALYLAQQLSRAAKKLLRVHDEANPPSADLLEALAKDLTDLIQGGSFYSVEDGAQRRIFEDVPKNKAIAEILDLEAMLKNNGQSLSGQESIRLNRLLLESAFADEIAPSYGIYYVAEPKPENIDPAKKCFATITEALAEWGHDAPRYGVIEILNSSVYTEQPIVELRPGQTLQIRAANRQRPVLRRLNISFSGPDALIIRGAKDSRIILDGLLIFGRGIHVENEMAEIHLRHCTLVPGWGLEHSCKPKNAAGLSLHLIETKARVRISHCILGAIQVEQDEVETEPLEFVIEDSILDATDVSHDAFGAGDCDFAHTRLEMKRCTVFGHVHTHALTLAENCIFMSVVTVARRQIGCMRFCYVTPFLPIDAEAPAERSRTPRRFNCQPDLVEKAVQERIYSGENAEAQKEQALRGERVRVRPQLNASHYGSEVYCQLAHTCATEIKRGADDESEMGVYHDLYQPQRETNLRIRLDEYTPAGMDAGIFFVN